MGASPELPRAPELPLSFPYVLQFGGQPTPPTMRPYLAHAAALGLKAGRFPRHADPLREGLPGPLALRLRLRIAAAAPAFHGDHGNDLRVVFFGHLRLKEGGRLF